MSRIVQPAEVERLLVQRRGDDGVNFVLHCIGTGALDVFVRRPPRAPIYLCKGQIGGQIREIDHVDRPRLIGTVRRIPHRMAFHRRADDAHGTLHNLCIAVDEWPRNAIHLLIRKCLDDDLGSDAGSVAHRDSKNWTQHISSLPL